MRTNIVLDEKLIREAMKLAKVTTKREAVDIALRRFVRSGQQKKLLELYSTGGVIEGYDHKRVRSGASCTLSIPLHAQASGRVTCRGRAHVLRMPPNRKDAAQQQ